MAKRGTLRLPLHFEEALSDLLKVKPPPKAEKGGSSSERKATRAKRKGAKK